MIDRLAKIPTVELPLPEAAIADTVGYLESDAASRSLAVDAYWPKWDSPWWHMVLLFELGEARRIPERAVRAMVDSLAAFPVKIFPIHPGELPAGADPYRATQCHCALGCMNQVLAACGIDVERELAWAGTAWFVRYQMVDGGLTCDSDAYLVANECPSSMVGTVAPIEAMLDKPPSAETIAFVDRAAGFLVDRRLTRGSHTAHNAEERAREPDWRQPCFPRFYFYDVLRGLHALARWAELRGRTIPLAAIEPAVATLLAAAPDGIVRVGRQAHATVGTRAPDANGVWTRRPQSSRFALLDATSVVGGPSPALTRQWADVRRCLLRLWDAGQIAAS